MKNKKIRIKNREKNQKKKQKLSTEVSSPEVISILWNNKEYFESLADCLYLFEWVYTLNHNESICESVSSLISKHGAPNRNKLLVDNLFLEVFVHWQGPHGYEIDFNFAKIIYDEWLRMNHKTLLWKRPTRTIKAVISHTSQRKVQERGRLKFLTTCQVFSMF